jgi:hypothetical protein
MDFAGRKTKGRQIINQASRCAIGKRWNDEVEKQMKCARFSSGGLGRGRKGTAIHCWSAGWSGERTRLACWFRRLAENELPGREEVV